MQLCLRDCIHQLSGGLCGTPAFLYMCTMYAQPDLFKYEKRCAAYAEVGRYRDALKDAQFIRDHSDGVRLLATPRLTPRKRPCTRMA